MNTQVDFAFLEQKYSLLTADHPSAVLSVSLSDLLERDTADRLIASVMQIIRAAAPDIAAYHLSSWLAMVCSAVQASLSLYDTVLLVSPERLRLHILMVKGRRKVTFLLREKEACCVSIEQAGVTRAEALNRFYELTMLPVFRGIAQATGTKEPQLWAQFVTRLYNERDFCLNSEQDPGRKRRIEEDFHILLEELEPDRLGLRRNPFRVQFDWIEHMQHPDERIRRKVACCLAYKTDTPHGYCYTCPRLDDEGRQAKRALHAR
jgi:hypothetical protein